MACLYGTKYHSAPSSIRLSRLCLRWETSLWKNSSWRPSRTRHTIIYSKIKMSWSNPYWVSCPLTRRQSYTQIPSWEWTAHLSYSTGFKLFSKRRAPTSMVSLSHTSPKEGLGWTIPWWKILLDREICLHRYIIHTLASAINCIRMTAATYSNQTFYGRSSGVTHLFLMTKDSTSHHQSHLSFGSETWTQTISQAT
jgi:hypothetical protein